MSLAPSSPPNQPHGPPQQQDEPLLPPAVILDARHGDPQMTVQEKAEAESKGE